MTIHTSGRMGHNSQNRSTRPPVVYAIAFDLDVKMLEQTYHNKSWQNAYSDIERSLAKHGFARQQGSVYFGNDAVDAVTCVLAVQDLTRSFAWFKPSVSDMRMLRIEDNNDLMPAIQAI